MRKKDLKLEQYDVVAINAPELCTYNGGCKQNNAIERLFVELYDIRDNNDTQREAKILDKIGRLIDICLAKSGRANQTAI